MHRNRSSGSSASLPFLPRLETVLYFRLPDSPARRAVALPPRPAGHGASEAAGSRLARTQAACRPAVVLALGFRGRPTGELEETAMNPWMDATLQLLPDTFIWCACMSCWSVA